jgi:hypothetical protein
MSPPSVVKSLVAQKEQYMREGADLALIYENYTEKDDGAPVRNPFIFSKYDESTKFIRTNFNIPAYYLQIGIRDRTTFTTNLITYLENIPHHISLKIKYLLFDRLHLHLKTSHVEVSAILSAVSTTYRREYGDLDTEWVYYIGMEGFLGYVPQSPQENRMPKIKAWLTDEVTLKENGSERLFNAHFRECVKRVLEKEKGKSQDTTIPLHQYVQLGSWMKGRGTETAPAVLEYLGKRFKSKRSKMSSGVNFDTDEIIRRVFERSPQVIRCFQKLEAGKVRDVAAADFNNYLRMDYISTFLDNYFSSSDMTPMYYKTARRVKMWREIVEDASDPKLIKIPIDQSNFDQNVTREMIKIVLDEIRSILPKDFEYVSVMDILIESMLSPDAIATSGTLTTPYIKGVASGWRWTAIMDTIINASQCQMVLDNVHTQLGRPVRLARNSWFQGDDARIAIEENEEVKDMILDGYLALGFKVNKSKNFDSRVRDEFLRNVAQGGRLRGYPARVVLSLTQSKPQSAIPTSRYDRINNIVTNHLLFIQRGGSVVSTTHLMLSTLTTYLSQHTRLRPTKADLICYIMTPKSMGGFGLCIGDPVYRVLNNHLMMNSFTFRFIALIPTIVKGGSRIISNGWKCYNKIIKDRYNLNIDLRKLEFNLVNTLPTIDRHNEVLTHAAFVEVFPPNDFYNVKDLIYQKTQDQAISSNCPVWRELSMPKVHLATLQESAIEGTDLLTLKKLLSLDSYEDLELLIQNKCSSNVISSWLKGDFKLSRPVSSQMDVVAMSALYDINHDYLLTRVLSRNRMSIGKIRAAMLFLELKLHTDVETMMQHPADVENGYVILSG